MGDGSPPAPDAALLRERDEVIAELRRSNAELQEFVNVVSHDLSAPLRAISGFLGLLEGRYGETLDEQATDYVRRSVAAALHLRALLDDALALARVREAPRRAAVDAGALVARCVHELEPALAEHGGHVDVGELPTLSADDTLLLQVFQNLLDNALKFRSEEPPRIAVRAERADDAWRFAVSDNGIGIDPRFRTRIFTMFRQLHGRDAYPGTGVGLTICQRAVESMGGTIWAGETEGPGSTFTFTIPDAPARAATATAEAA